MSNNKNNLIIEFDSDAIAEELGLFKEEVEAALNQGIAIASSMTHTKIVELANEKLNARRDKFLNALQPVKEISKGVFEIVLDEKAMWIENGKEPGSMVDDLLRKNPKVSKEGKRYKVIPFDQGNARAATTPQAQQTLATLKSALKKMNIPYKKLELDSKGSARLGKLHSLKIPSAKPTEKSKFPALYGLNIYQTKMPNGKVRRDLFTFRIVHEDHKAQGKWYHPGLEPANIMDEAYDWIMKTLDDDILPELLKNIT